MGVIGSLTAELASGIGVTDCAVQSEREQSDPQFREDR